jgi:uncharacterized protein (DUF433 family)
MAVFLWVDEVWYVCDVVNAFVPSSATIAAVARQDSDMTSPTERITMNPLQCGGKPCVRGMRIRVSDVLDLLAAGLTSEQVVAELPDLEPADIAACLRFASIRTSRTEAVA